MSHCADKQTIFLLTFESSSVSFELYGCFHPSVPRRRGRLPCPFRGHGTFEKGEVVLVNLSTDRSLSVTSLSIHLVERHDFFQGVGALYRIDPQVAAEMLNLL